MSTRQRFDLVAYENLEKLVAGSVRTSSSKTASNSNAIQETRCVDKLESWLPEKIEISGNAAVSQRFLEPTHYTNIPFTCSYFLSVCCSFVARCVGKVHWRLDFIHNVCKQRFKLGCFACLECHRGGRALACSEWWQFRFPRTRTGGETARTIP